MLKRQQTMAHMTVQPRVALVALELQRLNWSATCLPAAQGGMHVCNMRSLLGPTLPQVTALTD